MAKRYQEITNLIRRQILEGFYESGQMLPTEQLLCQEYQVSRQTIRHSLSLLVDEGLIEKRQGSGSRVRDMSRPAPMPRRSIAIVTTYISDYIFPSILREAETVLSQGNCAPLLFTTQNQVSNERKVLQALLALPSLDGVLVEGTKTALPNPNLDLYRQLLERDIPLVFINGDYPQLSGVLSILDDNYGGGYRLVEHLHGKGHVHIAGIFKSDDIQGHQRYVGYADALRNLGLPQEDRHLFWYNTEGKEGIYAKDDFYVKQMIKTLEGCTAVVCYNDEIASSLIRILLDQGVEIPQKMAVVSFDNSRYSDMSPLRITSLSHENKNVGRLAAEALISLLTGEPCASQLVPWVLIEKESS